MTRALFTAGFLPVGIAKALREEVERIDRATEAYEACCVAGQEYGEEASRLAYQIDMARAALSGVVRSILRRDEEAKRHA